MQPEINNSSSHGPRLYARSAQGRVFVSCSKFISCAIRNAFWRHPPSSNTIYCSRATRIVWQETTPCRYQCL